jgi:hypothetical protein
MAGAAAGVDGLGVLVAPETGVVAALAELGVCTVT